MERYILMSWSWESNSGDLERRLTIQMTDRELAVADKSLNYANVTVTYFFYIIAGVASLIALVGWQSLKELKHTTKEMADRRLNDIAQDYEKKFNVSEDLGKPESFQRTTEKSKSSMRSTIMVKGAKCANRGTEKLKFMMRFEGSSRDWKH